MVSETTLRPATQADEAFLFELFKSVRTQEFAPMGLPQAQLDMLLRIQYQGQTATYKDLYADSRHSIVLCGGVPVGRMWVHRGTDEYCLVDIAFLPDYRNKGIGTELVRQLIAEAETAGAPLRCSVATSNSGSLKFHQRLGFAVTGRDQMYFRLEYRRTGSAGAGEGNAGQFEAV
jgi:ribosomal protein S18 acetylase RimI-like enzyme